MTGHTPHPEFWTNFSAEKSSKELGLQLVWTFVNLSIPANSTDRNVVEQIAKQADIPIEFLCHELDHPLYTGGQVIFGFAGDEIDKVARGHDQMRWWISRAGLNVAIDNSAKSDVERISELVTSAAEAQFSGSHQLTPSMKEFGTARLGRPPNTARREAIRSAMKKYGDDWRDNLFEIFQELDSGGIPLLSSFQRVEIDLGNDSMPVKKWQDLDLTEGKQRYKIIDALRKYLRPI